MGGFLEMLFGGNMIAGTVKAALWIALFSILGGLWANHVLQ